MQISVVIPFTKESTHIPQLLRSLEIQQDIQFEVLLVLNPSADNWPQLPETSYPLIRLISDQGVNHARNEGLQHSECDIIVFLDADCIPADSRYLKNYWEIMQSQPELTGVGGFYLLENKKSLQDQAYHYLQTRWLEDGLLDTDRNCRHLLGGNLALRRSKLAGETFDENLKFGGTERELIQRLRMKGHQFLLDPNQNVWHSTELNTFRLLKKAIAQGRGARYIQEKLGKEKQTTLNLVTTEAAPELLKFIFLYNIFFELGFQKNYFYQIKKIWEFTLQTLLNTFLISKQAQSIKERKES